ncbi:hypothetical protein PR048_017173 [Dryococelus australis]|uniref:Uncharacterized protein n=1 Tax=Dryococelus australis TaxID=614101 RepID=A0ABQ9H9E6_9NEOP|nr:hypothetical protein PR048_017173 [Dryococelus australis]
MSRTYIAAVHQRCKTRNTRVERMLTKARAAVGRYTWSSVASEQLQQMQRVDQKTPLNVVKDVETRWNSEFQMLECLVHQRICEHGLHGAAEQQTAKILTKKDFQQLQDEQGLETQEEEAEDEKPELEEMSLWSAVLQMAQPAHTKLTANVEVKYNSKQLFSSAGNTVTFKRTLLSPEHIEQLWFLHDTLKQH